MGRKLWKPTHMGWVFRGVLALAGAFYWAIPSSEAARVRFLPGFLTYILAALAIILWEGLFRKPYKIVPWVGFVLDAGFITFLVWSSGNTATPFYLLYALLVLRTAWEGIRAPFLWWGGFLTGPLYVLALRWQTGDWGFLRDPNFLGRYFLLLMLLWIALIWAWRQVRLSQENLRLRGELARQSEDLASKTQVLQQTAADLGERVLELRALQEAARDLSTTLQMEAMLQMVADRLVTILNVPRGGVALLEEDRLTGVAASGDAPDGFAGVVIPLEEKTRAALEQKHPLLLSGDGDELPSEWFGAETLAVPLVTRGRAIGMLFAASDTAGSFPEKEQRLATSFSYFAAAAIENAMLYRNVWEKHSELEAILSGIGDGVIVAGPDLSLVLMNPVAARIFSLAGRPDPGTPLADFLPPQAVELMRRTLTGDDASAVEEISLDRPGDGRTWVYQALASRVVGEGQHVQGVVTVLRDVTGQKELERMKSNFLSVVSHELKTPLHSIKGFVEIILMGKTGPITEIQQDFLTTVKEQTDHLQRLIEDLLAFSRLESGELRLRLSEVPPAELVATVEQRLAPLAERNGLELRDELPSDFPTIHADPVRLEQVFTNLIENAIKFTPSGGSITVGGEDRGEEVLFWVRDTGIGIPPEEQGRIFERFYQVDSGPNRLYRGTGLGLSICKHIVTRHGGRIWVESEVGKGSTFYFTLQKRLSEDATKALDFG